MLHYTLNQKYNVVKNCCKYSFKGQSFYLSVGIKNIDIYHDIAKKLGMKDNPNVNISSLTKRVNKLMREFIKAGYSIKEERSFYSTKTPDKKYHPVFIWL